MTLTTDLQQFVRPIVDQTQPSGIARMIGLASQTQGDLIRLEIGDIDLAAPSWLRDGILEAFDSQATHYPPFKGDPALIGAIVENMRKHEAWKGKEDGVLITSGGSMALALAFELLLGPGDEALILQPAWPHLAEMVRLRGARPVSVALDSSDGFRPDPAQIEQFLSPRTKVLVLNSPTNPSGTIYSAGELRAVAEFAAQHRLAIVSDEEYEAFRYGTQFTSPAAFYEPTVAIRSFSKSLAIPGLRLGYLLAPPIWIAQMSKLSLYSTMYSSSLIQRALALTSHHWASFTGSAVSIFEQRMLRGCERLAQIPGITCRPSEGGVYLWPDCSSLCDDDWKFAETLLMEAKVSTVPGSAFGDAGRNFLRISLGVPLDRLLEAISRIDSWVGRNR